jgi:WD40 repeat protein
MQELDALPTDKPAAAEQDPIAIAQKVSRGAPTAVVGLAWQDAKTLRVTLRRGGNDFLMKQIAPLFRNKGKATLGVVLDQLDAVEVSLDGRTPPKGVPVDPAYFHSPLNTALAGSCFLANEGEMMTISCIARSADGKRLSMCGIAVDPAPRAGGPLKTGKVVVWDLAAKSITASYTFDSMGYASALSADGKLLAVGSSGGVLLYELGKPQPPRELPGGAGIVQALAFTSDGSLVAVADMSGAVRMWNVASGKEHLALRGHTSLVNRLAFAVGETNLVSAATDGELRVWDLTRPVDGVTIAGHEGMIHTLAFSAGGGELTAADTQGKYATYRAETGAQKADGKGPQTGSFVAALSAKGTWYAAASPIKIVVRDTRSGMDHTLTGDKLSALKLAFSPDEQYLAASSLTGETLVWKTATWEQLPPLTGKGPYAWGLVFAPHAPVLATAQGGKVVLHDLEKKTSRTLKLTVPGLPNLSYSPDGSLLAIGGTGEVRVYDLAADRERLKIAATGKETGALVFSADNRRLAAVSHASAFQCVVRMYDLESGREVLSLPLSRGYCTAIAFSPDSRRLAAAVTHTTDPSALAGRAPSPATIKIWEAPEPASMETNGPEMGK